jgi:ketosteroid isomerase-like protein
MSEQQNIGLIQSIYDAFGRGDIAAILEKLTPDVEWTMEGPSAVPFYGKRSGPQGAASFFAAIGTTQTDQKLTIQEWFAQGDRVITFGRYTATVTATGKTAEGPIAHSFTVRDGKVSRWVGYGDTADMFAAYQGSAAVARG